jgi:cob(I)alamin adenosyltransferase
MSTTSTINGQKIEKDNLIFEVLGCLDRCGVEIGSAKLEAGENITNILTQIQKDITFFSSVVAKCEPENHLQGDAWSHLGGETNQKLNWLKNQIKSLEDNVDIPKNFILPGKSELEVRLNSARVAVRTAERRLISLNRHQDLPQEFLDYFNRLSWFLFLLSLS